MIVTADTFIAILTAIGAAVTAYMAARARYRNTEADTFTQLTDAAKSLVEPLSLRIDQLERDRKMDKTKIIHLETSVQNLQRQLDIYIAGTAMLINQLRSMGLTPVWTPAQSNIDDAQTTTIDNDHQAR